MTVEELMWALEDAVEENPDMEVRLATQPSWPFEWSVETSEVVVLEKEDEPPQKVLYLVEGQQLGYLPEQVRDVFGW